MEEKRTLHDTPMTWLVRAMVEAQSTKEEEKRILLREMERLKASIPAFYPGAVPGSSFEECPDGTMKALIYTDSRRFGFLDKYEEGFWKRTTLSLFCGTVGEVKELLVGMAGDAASGSGGKDVLMATGSVSELEPYYSGYLARVQYRDGSSALYDAGLCEGDGKRFMVFELDSAVRRAQADHPGLPIVLIRDGKVCDDRLVRCEVSEFLDYDYSGDRKAFTSRSEFKEYLEWQFKFGKNPGRGPDLVQESCKEVLSQMEPYWTEAILVLTG